MLRARTRERERERERRRSLCILQESHVSIFGHSLEKENAATNAATATAAAAAAAAAASEWKQEKTETIKKKNLRSFECSVVTWPSVRRFL